MSKHRHRLVFNATLGQSMIPAARRAAVLRRPTFPLWAVFGLAAILPVAQAQIVADRAAPASQQPTVLNAGNGVPLVNIRTPSAAGVSRNTYSQFDVQRQGAILNNARTNALTQLGGWVQGNPWLAAGTARVILNEVNSSNPSLLQGYLEVAGSRAQVVIANPAGVTCDGCGFINAGRATLTTGTPIVSGGNLEGYLVERGRVTVQGGGLDASQSDYADLIARAIEVNAGIWANQLKITAGANRVDAAHAAASPIVGSGPAPAFAIDVASLGGMYANKIMLVGTEAGVGVRNAGYLGAAAGDVLVTADGLLSNSGHMAAAGAMRLNSVAGIDNAGTLYAQGDLHLATAGGILNSGIVAARGNATLTANRVDSTAGSVLGAGIRDDGTLAPTGDLAIHATQDIVARGQNLAGGDMTLNARSLDLSDSQTAARNLTLTAGAGDIDASRATLAADRALLANAAQTLRSRSAHLSAGGIDLRARDIDNTDGDIVGAGDSALALSGGFDNTRGTLAANAGTLSLAAAALDNSGGRLLSQGDIVLTLAGDYSHRGELRAGHDLRLDTAGRLTNLASLTAGNALNLTVAALDNAAGAEIAAVATAVEVSGTLANRGLIDGTDTRIDAGSLANLGTGRIYGDTLSIAATTLDNLAESTAAPVIAARHHLDIGARDIDNREQALLFSAGDMAIGGTLDAGRRATGRADTLANASATLEALGNLDLSVGRIDNSNLHFTTHEVHVGDETLNEYAFGSNRYAPGEVYFTWTPRPGTIYAPPATGGFGYMSGQGFFASNEDNYVILNTPGGSGLTYWLYEFNRATRQTQVASSEPGRILAGHAMRIDADTLTNDKSHVIAGGALTGAIGTLNNLEAFGTRTQTDTGTAHLFYPDTRHDDTDHNAYGYAPAPMLQTIRVAAARFEQNTAPSGSGATVPGLSTGGLPAIAGIPVNTVLPASSLFSTNPGSTARYLIETDPRFAGYRQWLTSDWMLAQLGIAPTALQKRLGDGFYEQRLLAEQVAALTGRRFLAGYSDDEAQYRALMQAGATWARQWNLIPGVALTAEQMALLTTDMVWLIEREATLPDGSKQTVLVPQLYARVKAGDIDGAGALLSANRLELALTGDITNLGTIAGRQLVTLSAGNIKNLGGRIRGMDAWLSARQDIQNLGGSITGEDRLTVLAGRDLRVESTTRSSESPQGSRTHLDRLAGLYVTGQGGTLVAAAGRDLDLIAAALVNAAPTAAGTSPSPLAGEGGGEGGTTLLAGRNLTLGTITEAGTLTLGDAKHNRKEAYNREVGTAIQTEGDLTLSAGEDLAARAARLTSQSGAVRLEAGHELSLAAGEASQSAEERHKTKSKSFLSTKKSSTLDAVADTRAVASSVSGDTVTLEAGRNLILTGSAAVSQRLTLLTAGGDIAIQAAEERHSERHDRKESQSGIFGSGRAGFTIGRRSLSQRNTDDALTAAASTVGSLEGDVTILAGLSSPAGGGGAGGEGRFTLRGSDLLAPQGDIAIRARRIDIEEARERRSVTQEVKSKQSGLTIAFSNPVISAVQTAQSMSHAASDTQDSRMRALAAANVALSGYNALNAVSAGQGVTVDGQPNRIAVRNAQGEVTGTRDATAADRLGGISLNLSLGSSKSKSRSVQTSDTAAGSSLHAGRDLALVALGGAGAGDLTVQGSALTAGRHLSLNAANDIRLLAASNETTFGSQSKSSSASLGVAIDLATLGVSATAGANAARGRAEGRDTAWIHTKVSAGDTVHLTSGVDTTLRGAVLDSQRIEAQVGGNLAIESLQDTATYRSRNASAGFSLSVPLTGGSLSGSVSAGSSRVESDYRSVNEQSAIRASEGGFDVAVQGDTALTGGAITSSQAAVELDRNHFATGGSLSLTDLQNRAEYAASSVSLSLGAGLSLDGRLAPQGTGAGLGRDADSASSTTLAAISGIAGNTTARTGDAQTGIAPIFDANRVQREIEAQARITQMFGQSASKAVGDYAQTQTEQARELRRQAAAEPADDRRAALEAEAQRLEGLWGDTGTLRIAAHALIGGLTGGASGAAGAAVGTITAPLVAAELAKAGIDGPLATAITGLASTAAGAAVGGTAGAATALNEVGNNFLYHYKGKIIAYDRKDNDKIVELSEQDLRKLAAQNPEILNLIIAGIGNADGAPILVSQSAIDVLTTSQVLDLNNPADNTHIAREAEMGYLNLTNKVTRFYVQTGMDNNPADAEKSARLLGEIMRMPTGYLNNDTDGVPGDVGEYLPNTLALKDVLNEYTYRTLDTHGPVLILTHSAGNEDARKALQAGALYGHQYRNLSFLSLGSPVGAQAMQSAVEQGGARFIGQVNDWRDPVTYSKTAGTVAVGSFLGGIGYGAVQGCASGVGGGWLGCILFGVAGGVAGGVPGIAGAVGLSKYHPFSSYAAKPEVQERMRSWLVRSSASLDGPR